MGKVSFPMGKAMPIFLAASCPSQASQLQPGLLLLRSQGSKTLPGPRTAGWAVTFPPEDTGINDGMHGML